MAMSEDAGTKSFAAATLPWVAAAGGFLVYLLTLNRWVSLQSLDTVVRVSGWSWRPDVGQPLIAVMLYPFRWLPESWIPVALNLFTAACAALVLALLARSVALLPHPLVPETPRGPKTSDLIVNRTGAWLAPALAVTVCGFQLVFWEHATAATGAMLDLLLFAYIIRCLLEFRIDQRQAWLSRSAFLYGAGMTNNWALLGFFPLFIVAVARVKGLGAFLKRRFLVRMALWGLAGLSFYLLLPAIYCLLGETEFWSPLKAWLREQKFALSWFGRPAFRVPALASLVPLLVLSIRWKSHTIQLADDTRVGIFITRASGHLIHIACFLGALWLGFNPVFGPAGRAGVAGGGTLERLGGSSLMLLIFYLAALVLGHCAGYILLFGWAAPRSGAARLARIFLVGVSVLVPVLLVTRNQGQILATNGPALRMYARQFCADLPIGESVLLGEDPQQLYLLRSELSMRKRKDVLLLETPLLGLPRYQAFMADAWKARWPLAPLESSQPLRPGRLVKLIAAFVSREPVLSVEPALGFASEHLQARLFGLGYTLSARPPHELSQSPLPGGLLISNQQIWAVRWTNHLSGLARGVNSRTGIQRSLTDSLLKALRLSAETNQTLSLLASWYSKPLNELGVQLQRAGQWGEAGLWFQHALELYPDNLVAQINLQYNQQYQRGDKSPLKAEALKHEFPEWFAKPAFWREALREGGRVDEPTFLFRTGRLFFAAGFSRQAANEFARCAGLAADWPQPKLWLARSALELGEFSQTLELTAAIEATAPPREPGALAQLLQTRAAAFRALGQTNEAAVCISDFVAKYGQHREVLLAAADAWEQAGRFDAELALLDQLLRREPERTDVLVLKGSALLKAGRYDDAITVLNAALSASPSDEQARLCRAVAFLGAEQLDNARADYDLLLRGQNVQDALFGLATVAWRKQDTNTATRLYRQYLTNATPGSLQYKIAAERIGQSKASE